MMTPPEKNCTTCSITQKYVGSDNTFAVRVTFPFFVSPDMENRRAFVCFFVLCLAWVGRDMILLDKEECGKQYNRGFFVNRSDSMLFGYCYADPKRTLLTSRDRNSINHDLGARVCSKMVRVNVDE